MLAATRLLTLINMKIDKLKEVVKRVRNVPSHKVKGVPNDEATNEADSHGAADDIPETPHHNGSNGTVTGSGGGGTISEEIPPTY